jgi:hypothetical protein
MKKILHFHCFTWRTASPTAFERKSFGKKPYIILELDRTWGRRLRVVAHGVLL